MLEPALYLHIHSPIYLSDPPFNSPFITLTAQGIRLQSLCAELLV